MSEQGGEKTEQPTAKRMEEALRQGNFPRSQEVQTVFVLCAATAALVLGGREAWNVLGQSLIGGLGHLHETPVNFESMQGQTILWVFRLCQVAGPILLAAALGGLIAGGIQSRFQTSPEALNAKWERLNPITGLQRIFSTQNLTPSLINMVKMAVILAVCYGDIVSIIRDPIFHTTIDTARIASFLAQSTLQLILRVAMVLGIIAAADYAYQFWKNHRDLMMTKEEVKEEAKSTEGNPQIKAAQRRRKNAVSVRKMLSEVPKADVIVTNPTHLAIALRYDRKSMKAPRIVAKGSRLNALRIREIARQHQVPIIENKPLARMMFKYGRVGGEIPAQLYSAVAEVLAWVYRINRYKYYVEQQQS